MLLHGLVALKKREMDSMAGKKYSVRKTIIFYGRNFISFLVFFCVISQIFFAWTINLKRASKGWLSHGFPRMMVVKLRLNGETFYVNV